MNKLIILVSLMLVLACSLMAEQITIGNYQNDIRLVSSSQGNSQIEFTLGSFLRDEVTINGQTWYQPTLKKSGLTLEAGLPQVPVLAASVIIPANAKMELSTIHSEYVEMAMPIAPSKGNLTRDVNPDLVPWVFGDFYNSNSSYPAENAYLTEPFILRDYRGITVRVQPFVYYPETGITRIYTKLVLNISTAGVDTNNVLATVPNSYASEFSGIYENMFLNFAQAKYPLLGEEGRILVIKHSMFDAAIQPWVDWKKQIGYTVDVVDVTVAGPTANQIKTYIQNQYNLNNGLMFVQIMGDAPQVPSLSSGGGGSDPSFALLAGNDNYPDIYVGRFSAQNVAEMNTQIQRSVYYERDVASGAIWLQRGMGIASNEGGGSQGDNGESDQAHMELIRTDLLGYGYTTVDQMYQTMGASATQVSNNVNNGRGFINYVGHGSDTSWVTTGFNNSNVNSLTNDFMLPFIVSVACVNGNFVSQTCFAEAWLRATNNSNGNPTGAVAMYAATINQGWNPPMRGQDEITDLLIAETRHTIGGLYFNGSSKMIEVYGTSGVSEYKCWTIFGDASLTVRTKNPEVMTMTYSPVLLLGMSTLSVQTDPGARLTLSANGTIYGKAIADASGAALIVLDILPTEPMDLTLTGFAFNKQTNISTVQVLPANGPYIVLTGVTVSGNDANGPVFGETVSVNVGMENVGSDPATGVVVSISTIDPYLTIVTGSETVADIPANSMGSTINGVQFAIASNVPDQHVAEYTITVTLSDQSVYTYDQSFVIGAPNINFGFMQVDDASGNSNGRIDPGETFIVSIPFTNNGHATSPAIFTTVIVNGGDHILSPILNDFTALPANGEGTMINQISLSSQIPAGTTIQITAMAMYGEYSAIYSYNVVVGILLENFESDFGNFPWSFTGANWATVPNSYNGTNAARTGIITHSQSTAMSITMTNPADGFISFWKKVSSEQNYDQLKFYINGILKNQWSGTSDDWSQVSYMVMAGTNTYRWEYSKDSMTSAGNDCAWIDDVIFPANTAQTGAPNIVVDQTSLDFGNVHINESATQTIVISNTGNAPMLGYIEVQAPYTLGAVDAPWLGTLNYTLAEGESMNVSVSFLPTEEGVFASYLNIHSDDPEEPLTSIFLMASATPVANEDMVNPVVTSLIGNYPNPFNPTTTIKFSLKERGDVKIEIYNVLGQRVRTLASNELAPGTYNVTWNGTDTNGKTVASGMYFYKMQTGKYTSTKKMILMK